MSKSNSNNSALKKHYFLVAAIVMAIPATEAHNIDNPDVRVSVSTVPVNGVVTADRREFGVAQIAKAQQVAQQMYYKHVPHNEVQVVDVVIQSINYLGFMTEGQYFGQKTPEELQREAEAVAAAAGIKLAVDNTAKQKGFVMPVGEANSSVAGDGDGFADKVENYAETQLPE